MSAHRELTDRLVRTVEEPRNADDSLDGPMSEVDGIAVDIVCSLRDRKPDAATLTTVKTAVETTRRVVLNRQ